MICLNFVTRSEWRACLARTLCVVLTMSMTVLPAKAVVYPEDVHAHIEAEIERFVEAPGFYQLDPAYFDSPEWNSPERFPFGVSPYYGNRDWGMSDAGKAIMALEAFEPALPHTRYRVSVIHVDGNAEYRNVMRLVEVVRLNVGPALAASIRESYGDQFTPSAEDIGVGADTAWRFAMVSSQGLPNQILALSRRILSEVDAQRYDCLGVPCLALSDPGDEGTDWTDISVDEDGDIQPYRTRDERGLSVPTRVADLLSGQKLHGEDLDMVISHNVVGQDTTSNGILRDGADGRQWTRRTEIAGMAAFWSIGLAPLDPFSAETGLPPGFDPGETSIVETPTDNLPAWQFTLMFETRGQPTQRYEALINHEVSTYRTKVGDHILFSVPQFPAFLYARQADEGIALNLRHSSVAPGDLAMLRHRIFDTGKREQMGRYEARELRIVSNLPDPKTGTYRVWTGPLWVIPDLPAAAGLQALPGSPFAGNAAGYSRFWQSVGGHLEEWGLLARAEITVHLGLSASEVERLLMDDTDNSRFQIGAPERQTVRIRIGNLAPAPDGALARVFPQPQRIGSAVWPGPVQIQTVPLLDQ